jgi:hypothetical protein
MGFFKSMRDLQKQSNEINKNWDVGAQLEDAQVRMQGAQEMMAAQTAAANAALTGIDGTATIVAVRQGQAMVNFQPMLEIDLTVIPAGGMPYPATVKQVTPQVHLAQAQPGASVHVKIAQDDPASVWIDWTRPA